MKKLFVIIFSVFLFVINSLVAFGQNSTRGVGVIEVNSEYITYRDVIRTRSDIGSSQSVTGGGRAGNGPSIEYYTVRERVKADHNLIFAVYDGNTQVFRGRTPVRVTNFDTGITYTIVWIDTNGRQQEGTFVIANTRPFTRAIHLE